MWNYLQQRGVNPADISNTEGNTARLMAEHYLPDIDRAVAKYPHLN